MTEAGEGGAQRFSETGVHKAVNDGVDAGRGVGQEVDERNGRPGQRLDDGFLVKGFPRVDDVQRHPADEEQGDDDQQHPDDPTLGLQLGLGSVAAGALGLGLAGGRQSGKLHGRALLLDVAAVVIVCNDWPRQSVLLRWKTERVGLNQNNVLAEYSGNKFIGFNCTLLS